MPRRQKRVRSQPRAVGDGEFSTLEDLRREQQRRAALATTELEQVRLMEIAAVAQRPWTRSLAAAARAAEAEQMDRMRAAGEGSSHNGQAKRRRN
jgi:hypothetical protein